MIVTRRSLLKAGGLAVGATALGVPGTARDAQAQQAPAGITWPPDQALPTFAPPVHLDVADVTTSDFETQTLLTTLQGVVNRTRPRLYCFLFDTDRTWLQTATRVPYTLAGDPWALVAKYAGEARGSIVWDPAVPDSLNVATSLAGVENAVVASPDLATKLAAAPYNLPVVKDLRGQFADKFAAYEWALSALWPRLTSRMLVGIAPQLPGVSSFPYLRDYIVANRALVFWLDPAVEQEANLFASILDRVAADTPYLGWFVDQHESQGVTLCSQKGVPVLAADYVTNFSVWSGVPGEVSAVQPQVATPTLENKIYLTMTMSDGDNLQFDERRIRQLWDQPARGKVPINWSISPMLINAAPAMYTYYQRTQTANDLLVAGPSGAGYTYPGDWPTISMLNSYCERTADLMKRGGLDIIYMLNRIEFDDIPLSDPVAEAYLRYLPNLRGVSYNGLDYSNVAVAAGELPVINQPWNITSVSTAQSAVATATAGWDGQSPMFVAIQPIAAAMNTTDIVTFAESLGPEYVVVRGDAFFDLLRQRYGLPVIPPGR